MKRMPRALSGALFCLLLQVPAVQAATDYDYFLANRILIRNGVQAVLMCNGLFTSGRTLSQVFSRELTYIPTPVGSVRGGDYDVDQDRRAVAVGGGGSGPEVRAVFREGVGCVVMAPGQSVDAIDSLPELPSQRPARNLQMIPWPAGDLIEIGPLPDGVDGDALQAASEWAFQRDSPEQVTVSLLILHRGQILHERYARGFNLHTRTRTWSIAKSIAATLIGMLVDQGRLQLDAPLDIDWLPEVEAAAPDPRRAITLRHLLHMASGLYPVDSFGMEYATGSGLAYWAGASSVEGARRRGLIREPGTLWEYENYDTLLAVLAMRQVLGDDYLQFPRRALLEPLGMHNTLLSTDRFGDFILSSQVYTNARDLARLGQLYLQGGVWNGERLLSTEWIDFVRTPAPATAALGHHYGGHWWLVPEDRDDVPPDAYAAAGNRGQYLVVVPSHELVIVRRGLDYGAQGLDEWDLTREVLKAFAPAQ
jgi:CubicO group peptidase (beta-lactamase class C family)